MQKGFWKLENSKTKEIEGFFSTWDDAKKFSIFIRLEEFSIMPVEIEWKEIEHGSNITSQLS